MLSKLFAQEGALYVKAGLPPWREPINQPYRGIVMRITDAVFGALVLWLLLAHGAKSDEYGHGCRLRGAC